MEFEKELKNFLDEDGRLTKYPSKRKPRMAALQFMSEKFEPERRYTEKEVNEIIDQNITFGDICFVRRELIDYKLLGREKDGSEYWAEKPRESDR